MPERISASVRDLGPNGLRAPISSPEPSAERSPRAAGIAAGRPRAVIHISTFPPEHCGIARHLALWAFQGPGDRAVVVLANRVSPEEPDNDRVRRVWRKGDPFYPLRLAAAVRRLAHGERATVLVQHQFFLYGGVLSSVEFVPLLGLLRVARCRVAVQIHGVTTGDHLAGEARGVGLRAPSALVGRGLAWFYRSVARWANLIVVQTPAMKDALVERYGVAGQGIEVVPLAWGATTEVDPATAKRDLGFEGRFLVVFHGFLDPTKGLDSLLAGFAEAAAQRPEFRLALVGEESPTLVRTLRGYAERLERSARDLGLADKVTFTGYVPPGRLPTYLAAADAIVLPYTGRSVLSGSSVLGVVGPFGRPLVVSETSRFSSELTDGVTALFVPPDDPSALARALLRLAGDPARARELGAAVQRLAADRSAATVAREFDRVLSRLEGAAP